MKQNHKGSALYDLEPGEYDRRLAIEKRHVAETNVGDSPAIDPAEMEERMSDALAERPEDWGAKKPCGKKREIACTECGKTFTTWYATTKYCSDKCQQNFEAARKRKHYENNRKAHRC